MRREARRNYMHTKPHKGLPMHFTPWHCKWSEAPMVRPLAIEDYNPWGYDPKGHKNRSDIHFLSPQHLTFSPLEPSPWSQQPVKEVFHKARITWLLHQPSCFEFHPTEKDNSPGKTTGHTHPAPLITMSTVID
jgi:hypothetical protein